MVCLVLFGHCNPAAATSVFFSDLYRPSLQSHSHCEHIRNSFGNKCANVSSWAAFSDFQVRVLHQWHLE